MSDIEDIEKLERLLKHNGIESEETLRSARYVALSLIADWKAMRGEIERLESEVERVTVWNHSVSVCSSHVDEVVDGPCLVCEIERLTKERGEARDAGARCGGKFADDTKS